MGVEEQLKALLLKYIPSLGGVVVSYSDVSVLSTRGGILHNFAHVKFAVKADFVVYSPRVGSELLCLVNKVEPDFVGLLAQGVFNVSVTGKGLRGYSHTAGRWEPEGGGSDAVELGSHVRVVVRGVKTTENGRLFITGALPGSAEASDMSSSAQPGSGVNGAVEGKGDVGSTESGSAVSKKKKRKRKREGVTGAESDGGSQKKKKKKKKKRKSA